MLLPVSEHVGERWPLTDLAYSHSTDALFLPGRAAGFFWEAWRTTCCRTRRALWQSSRETVRFAIGVHQDALHRSLLRCCVRINYGAYCVFCMPQPWQIIVVVYVSEHSASNSVKYRSAKVCLCALFGDGDDQMICSILVLTSIHTRALQREKQTLVHP